jgi:hypothetical protein
MIMGGLLGIATGHAEIPAVPARRPPFLAVAIGDTDAPIDESAGAND